MLFKTFYLDWDANAPTFQDQLNRQGIRLSVAAPVEMYENCHMAFSEMENYGLLGRFLARILKKRIMHDMVKHVEFLEIQEKKRK